MLTTGVRYFPVSKFYSSFLDYLMAGLLKQLHNLLHAPDHAGGGQEDAILCVETNLVLTLITFCIPNYKLEDLDSDSTCKGTLRGRPGLARDSFQGTGATLQSMEAIWSALSSKAAIPTYKIIMLTSVCKPPP